MVARPSEESRKLEAEKLDTQLELAKIKSVQLEFVKHSLLARKIIKIEKQLEIIQGQYVPKSTRTKKYLRIARVSIYCGGANALYSSVIYLYLSFPL
jgi:hypothetical protein